MKARRDRVLGIQAHFGRLSERDASSQPAGSADKCHSYNLTLARASSARAAILINGANCLIWPPRLMDWRYFWPALPDMASTHRPAFRVDAEPFRREI